MFYIKDGFNYKCNFFKRILIIFNQSLFIINGKLKKSAKKDITRKRIKRYLDTIKLFAD